MSDSGQPLLAKAPVARQPPPAEAPPISGWGRVVARLRTADRRRLLGVGAALALVAGIVVNEYDPRRVSTPADAAAAAELVTVLERGQAATYYARFQASSEEGQLEFEMWRRPPEIRQRVSTRVDGKTEVTDVIVTADDVISCSQPFGAVWTCVSSPDLRSSLDTLDPIPEGALDGERVTKQSRTVAGESAHCFAVEIPNETTSEVCVSDDGIPLLLKSDGYETKLISLERTVAGDAFVPPVEPVVESQAAPLDGTTPGEQPPASAPAQPSP